MQKIVYISITMYNIQKVISGHKIMIKQKQCIMSNGNKFYELRYVRWLQKDF